MKFATARCRKLVAVGATAVAIVAGITFTNLQGASAFTGSTDKQVSYPSSCAGFTYLNSAKVGDSGIVKVYWKASTKQNCVVLEKTKNVGKATATALTLCSTDLVTNVAPNAGKHVTGAQCEWATGLDSSWNTVPADFGNFKQYAGPIVIKASKCLYVGAYTSTAADSSPTWFNVKQFKDRDSFVNKPGTGRWGC